MLMDAVRAGCAYSRMRRVAEPKRRRVPTVGNACRIRDRKRRSEPRKPLNYAAVPMFGDTASFIGTAYMTLGSVLRGEELREPA
jgi:hypothetical protein